MGRITLDRRTQKYLIGEKIVSLSTAVRYIKEMRKENKFIRLIDLAI